LLGAGCAPTTDSSPGTGGADVTRPNETRASVNCRSLLDRIIQRERQEDTSAAINADFDALGDQCPSEYQVYVDYLSIKGFARIGAGGTCTHYHEFDVEPAAIELAQSDGFCSRSELGADADASEPGSGFGSVDPVGPDWTCSYEPTYDYDWHDDVLCSNGTEVHRPYLREWDSYVTQDEIMESAREYVKQLNGY
jgi:hypothetical protein